MEAKAKRKIRGGREYDRYFPVSSLKRTDPIIIQNGDVYDTLVQMKKIVRETLADTREIAKVLKGNNLEGTCRNIWNFVYQHIQYVLDKQGVEQLRRPARAWADRNSGVDCDCYSIFISSILTNLGISHSLRMAKYKADWQHVYVIVPAGPKKHFTIDCVVDQFNYEVPFSDKHDTEMGMPIQFLDGLGEANNNVAVPRLPFGQEFSGFGRVGLGTTAAPANLYQDLLVRIKMHLENTRAILLSDPKLRKSMGDFPGQVQYLLDNWDDDNARTMALAQLEEYEAKMGLGGFGGLFSKIGGAIKSAAKAVGTGVSNATSWVGDKAGDAAKAVATGVSNAAVWTADKAVDATKAVGTGVKNAAEWTAEKTVVAAKAVGTGVSNAALWTADKTVDVAKAVGTGVSNAALWTADKAVDVAKAVATGVSNAATWTADKAVDAAQAIVKYNPLSIAIRNGLLLALKLNLFRMSERLGYAYWTEAEATRNGLNITEWRKLKEVHEKVVKIFDGLQGDQESLKTNIKQGWELGTKKHNLPRGNGISGFGFTGLGYTGLGVVETAAAAAVATPIIVTITGLLSAIGGLFLVFKPDYSKDNKVPDGYIPPASEEEYNANPDAFAPTTGPAATKKDNTLIYAGVGLVLLYAASSQQS